MNEWTIDKPVRNDSRLFQPTKVRVLRSFCVAGRRLEVGTEVEIPYHVARDLRAIGKAEFVMQNESS